MARVVAACDALARPAEAEVAGSSRRAAGWRRYMSAREQIRRPGSPRSGPAGHCRKPWIGSPWPVRQSAATMTEAQPSKRLGVWAWADRRPRAHSRMTMTADPCSTRPAKPGQKLSAGAAAGKAYFFRNWSSDTTLGPSSPDGGVSVRVGGGSSATGSADRLGRLELQQELDAGVVEPGHGRIGHGQHLGHAAELQHDREQVVLDRRGPSTGAAGRWSSRPDIWRSRRAARRRPAPGS